MAFRKIVIKGDPIYSTVQANAAITPGHLVEYISTGKVQKQAGNALNYPMMFMIEKSLRGGEIGDACIENEQIEVASCYGGCEVYAWLSDGENVVIGDELEVGTTDGEFIKRSSGTPVAIAREAKDLSNSANAAAGRIHIQII